jgi:soluble lytic murein transglycosylase-like protein
MTQRTVIDELVIVLGLDPKKFNEGQKEAAKGLNSLRDDAKKTGDEVEKSTKKQSDGLMALGKRVLTVAALFKVLSYTTRSILDASKATYDLANSARGLDTAANRLRNYENVAEMFGGTADGARKSVEGLHKAIFAMSFNGQMSEQLVMLGRLGVQFQDANGHMREFRDVYLDTADKIAQARQQTGMTEGEAMEYLRSAGFDDGLARAAVNGRAGAEAALARQEARRQVSAEDVAAATANEQAITSAGQAKDTAFTAGSTKTSAAIVGTAKSLEGAWAAGATGDIGTAWEELAAGPIAFVSEGMTKLAESTDNLGAKFVGLSHKIYARMADSEAERAAYYEGAVQRSAKAHGVPADILAGLLHTESRFNPDAVNKKSGATGIAQFMPETAAGRGFVAGQDPLRDIDEAAEYLAELKRGWVKKGKGDAEAMDLALMSYNAGRGRVNSSSWLKEGGEPLMGETIAYPGHVYEYAASRGDAMAGGNETNVQIDQVTVNTQATNADGMADGAAGALRRKLSAANAEQGMQ